MTVLGGRPMYLHPDFSAEMDLKPDQAVISTYQALKGRAN